MRDEAFFKALGHRVAKLRQQAGLSQSQLAAQLGFKQQAWATYENATRRLPASLLVPLAETFEVSFEELLGVETPQRKRGPVPKLQRQFEAINGLPKGEQKFFSEMIERFLNETASV
ncbi:MAG: helix-turn-helix transcriptional regulator [Verrucomicrobiales bacterium]|nr:helix-turn-helix transcriptional regulator [Verrucomicrobiales bacterium]